MTILSTILGFDSSEQAQFTFHVLKVFYERGWKVVKLAFPNLKRPTLYRWKKTYEESGKRLNSLIPKSTKPNKVRLMQTPPPVYYLIKSLREKHPRLGKAKIKRFVDVFCKAEGIPNLSESTIGKVIKRNNLFYAGKERGRKNKPNSSKTRVIGYPRPSDTKLGYIQLDGVKFYYLGRYYYFLTAVDIVSKQAWIKLIPSLKSKHAAAFLKGTLKTFWHKIHTIQTDNGSEFELFFEHAVKEANLTHLWNYPHSPKTTAFVERFNWTV